MPTLNLAIPLVSIFWVNKAVGADLFWVNFEAKKVVLLKLHPGLVVDYKRCEGHLQDIGTH